MVKLLTVVLAVAAVGWRTRRWRYVWVPIAIAIGVAGALAARTYVDSEGLASDPAPPQLWLWTGCFVAAVAVAILGWRGTRWWRRALSILLVPLSFAAALVVLNEWVGYYPTVSAAWGALTAGPLPDEIDVADLAGLRGTVQDTGKVVQVDIPDDASGFAHRSEYVYLPPAWFAGTTPPALPALMMIAGEFNTPADWLRSGGAIETVDDYAGSHNGQAPILVFVDSGGSFNNDTECVDGPRGNAADHLTDDVRQYLVSTFGASAKPENWGVVGWSMGGTCAVDLTVMHPDLFTTFEDIAGDAGPTAGTKDQTIDRLFDGDATQWDAYDPATVMVKHGPYVGVSGWFEDTGAPPNGGKRPQNGNYHPPPRTTSTPSGYGGHDDIHDTGELGAADTLCKEAAAQQISCDVHTVSSGHTWQFATQAFTDALPWLADHIGTDS
ncbi:alpha/beta hydrolase-fold protein [Antrihabitans spumae]|uniref:Alpha/beta hydrolase-fold protein n=1 Tax=Antrihabitans spumae TaxID=3373370 RepID=A0ABW7KDF5_9NOCA